LKKQYKIIKINLKKIKIKWIYFQILPEIFSMLIQQNF
jgi:hypothetical protein